MAAQPETPAAVDSAAALAALAAAQNAISIDGPLLRVPCESLKGRARERTKVLNTELAQLVSDASAALASAASAEAQESILSTLESRLQTLRCRFSDVARAEASTLEQCCARVEHLGAGLDAAASEDALRTWERVRLDRLLAEHLLRSGASTTGAQLASAAGVEALVDAELHTEHMAIVTALSHRDPGHALTWCETHRSRLAKMRSNLEFRLRLQQLIELAARGDTKAALHHARAFVAPAAVALGTMHGEHLHELQRIMTMLVCRTRGVEPAGAQHGWETLATAFLDDASKLHGISRVSSLMLRLQAGLVALNPPHASHTQRSDPLRDEGMAQLAAGLPNSKHVHTRLVCRLTGEVMDEHNPPAALPNGQVYSRAALETMAQQHGGQIKCPHTGDGPYDLSQLQKVFLA